MAETAKASPFNWIAVTLFLGNVRELVFPLHPTLPLQSVLCHCAITTIYRWNLISRTSRLALTFLGCSIGDGCSFVIVMKPLVEDTAYDTGRL
jgi:hypothetical protein